MALLDDTTINDGIAHLDWERDGDALVKVVRRHDFAEALRYVNEVGRIAEEVGHHPDFEVHWNTVTLRLWTHSRGGITDLDLDLAQRIDAVS
jgi:4a-hydroxytetrahydrobiopterin dehydratase